MAHPWDQPTSQALPQVNTGWTPKFGWGIPSDRPLGDISQPGEVNLGVDWVDAPSTSHISRFRFLDAREHSLIRKFGRVVGSGGSSNPFSRGASELHVIFKGKGGRGEDSQYAYYFNDHQLGQDLFERMMASPHPYGDVLHPDVIYGNKVPYQRISRI